MNTREIMKLRARICKLHCAHACKRLTENFIHVKNMKEIMLIYGKPTRNKNVYEPQHAQGNLSFAKMKWGNCLGVPEEYISGKI